MKPIAIIRHVAHEGPGHLAELVARRGLPMRLFAVDAGDALPTGCRDFAAIVSMGGPMSANDALPWIADEIALVRAARDAGLPVLGHCLGAQIICRALGGQVVANPVVEIGWHDVDRLPTDGAETAWLAGLPARFEAFHWHGERCVTPPGAVSLLASAYCPVQGFALDNILALQCHLEMTPGLVEDWVARHRDELADHTSPAVARPEQILAGLEGRIGRMQAIAATLYGRWLDRVVSGQQG